LIEISQLEQRTKWQNWSVVHQRRYLSFHLKNFQAPKKQVAWQAENHSFWAKKSFSNSGEKILFWHGLVEISPRNLRALALIVFILFFNVGY